MGTNGQIASGINHTLSVYVRAAGCPSFCAGNNDAAAQVEIFSAAAAACRLDRDSLPSDPRPLRPPSHLSETIQLRQY